MKSISSLIMFFLISFHITAQQFNVSIKDNLKYSGYSREGKFGNRIYALEDVVKKRTTTEVKLIVNKKDENNELVLKSSPTPLRLIWPKSAKLFQSGGRLYLTFQEREVKGYAEFKVAEIDTTTMEIGTPRIIADFKKGGYDTKPGTGWESQDRDYFERSPDSSKFLFFFANEVSAANIYICVTDTNLNVLWQRMENLGRSSNELSIKRAVIDNNGNVYLAYKLIGSKKVQFAPGDINHIAVFNDKKKVIDKKIDLKEAQMKEIALRISQNNESLLFGGFYFVEDFDFLEGAFSGQMNLQDYKIAGVRKEDFPDKLLAELETDGWAETKKKKYGVRSNIIPFPFSLPDGSVTIFGEFRRTEQGTNYKTGAPTGSFMIAGSILYINLNNSSSIFSRIPKARVSAGTATGDSYSVFTVDDKIILFYNDKESNLSKKLSEAPDRSDNYSNVVLAAAIIDKNGAVSRQKVVDLQKEDFMALTSQIYKDQKNVFVVTFVKVKSLGGFKSEAKIARIEVK